MRLKGLYLSILFLAGMIAVACGGRATPTPPPAPTPGVATPRPAPPPPAGATPAPTPIVRVKPSGELRVAVSSFVTEALNPILNALSGAHTLDTPMFDHLLGANPDGTVGPGIAESWEMARDGLSWTFKLRKGVKFHNGETLDAEDVKFSLLAHARKLPGAPTSVSSAAGTMNKLIKNIDIIDPYTIRINTDGISVDFPFYVGPLQASEGAVMPKDYIEKVGWEEFNRKPVGSGPWKFIEHVVGSYIKWEAGEDHWRAVPAFKRLTLYVVPEESTRLALLKTGQGDIVEISPESRKQVEAAGFWVGRITEVMQSGLHLYGTYVPEVADKPTAKVKVREALSLAINREEIVKYILEGEGSAQTYPWYVFPFSADLDFKALPKPEYDPERAKRLLSEAGYAGGFPIDLYVYSFPGAGWLPKHGEAIAGYWDKIGVKAKILPIDYATHRARFSKQPPDPRLWGQAASHRSPSRWVIPPGLRIYYHSQDLIHLANLPELDGLIDGSMVEPDQKKRTEMVTRAATLGHNEFVAIPTAYANALFGISNKIESWQTIPGWTYISLAFETVKKKG